MLHLHYFVLCSPYFQEKSMGAVSAFITRNYPYEPAAAYLCVRSVNLSFMLEFKSDVIKDVSSAKIGFYSINNSRKNIKTWSILCFPCIKIKSD